METDNIVYFNNDDEFEEFALEPITVTTTTGPEGDALRMCRNFTRRYHDAVGSGKKFCIRDERSHVNKDGLLGTRWATYPIPAEYIEKYWGDEV